MVDGLRNLEDGFIPPIFETGHGTELLNRKTVIRPKDSILWVRKLSSLGLFVGLSTGAAMAGAARCANDIESGVIVVVSPDGGWKYLSSGAWSGSIDDAAGRSHGTIYF
jgi:cysteine synthase B